MALILPRRKAGAVDIADVFSTDLYTGNGSTQTITNGIDLSGEGGLVWVKSRSNSNLHFLWDTERGATKYLISSATDAEGTIASGITAFNSDGFSIGSLSDVNLNTQSTVGWTFRKSPNFFDVVTYTGVGGTASFSHNLGAVPGMMIVKRLDAASDWTVYHRANTSAPETDHLNLNTTAATVDIANRWGDTAPTDTQFTGGGNAAVNLSGGTYVAYLFAHDTTDNGVIQCGSYTGNGATRTVTLGWKPQFILIKPSSAAGNWLLFDDQRGLNTSFDGRAALFPNLSSMETDQFSIRQDATGFSISQDTVGNLNVSPREYIYVAIRKEGV